MPNSIFSSLSSTELAEDIKNEGISFFFFLIRIKLMVTERGRMLGEATVREFGTDMYALLCLKWITNKDLLHSTGNSAQCHVAAWMGGGGVWGRMGVYS